MTTTLAFAASHGLLTGVAVGQNCLSGEVEADEADRDYTGENPGDNLGMAVAGIGDVAIPPGQQQFVIQDEAVFLAQRFNGGNSKVYVVEKLPADPFFYAFEHLSVAEAFFDHSGDPVSAVGDVDGDGRPDFIVGGWFTAVYSGADGSVIVSFAAEDEDPADDFGHGLTGVGDLDGNGYDDVAVGAPFNTTGGTACQPNGQPGRVYVFLTPDNGYPAWDGTHRDALTAEIIFTGNEGDWLGFDIEGEDVNGDGVRDLIMTAPYARTGASCVETGGKVYIYFFCPCLVVAPGQQTQEFGAGTADLDSDVHVVIEMTGQIAYFGWSVDGGGDFDGGGLPDVAIGTYKWKEDVVVPPDYPPPNFPGLCDPGMQINIQTGKVYVFLGEDHDGFADPPCGGQPIAYPACTCTPNTVVIDTECAGIQITGRQDAICKQAGGGESSISFGYDVAFVGRVNSDGFDDLLVGAPWYDEGILPEWLGVTNYFPEKVDAGAAYLFLGTNAHASPQALTSEDADVEFVGVTAFDLFGASVDGHGRANPGNLRDIIIGAPGVDVDPQSQTDEGRVYVFFPCGPAFHVAP